MILKRRHKYVLLALCVYWPAIFIATHIPVPDLARRSGMSDKMMHFCAYLLLAFVAWLSLRPYERINWNRWTVYCVLFGLTAYAAIDEWLQMYVGRGADILDFAVNLIGIATAMVILSIFTFWPALLIVGSMLIFTLTNLTSKDTLCSSIFLNAAFHFTGYAALTLIWIQYMHRYTPITAGQKRWLLASLLPPVAYLGLVKVFSLIVNKHVFAVDIYTAITGIALAVAVSWCVCTSHTKRLFKRTV